MFCLIHGSTQSPSGFDLLVRELESLGHQVICPDLPVDKAEASGTYYAEAVAAALRQSAALPIAVAHSVSGLFLPLVAKQRPVARLVFLGATIPQVGKSALEQLQANPDMVWPDWVGKDPTKDPQVAMKFLFHDCAPDVARWALSTLRLMYARGALTEICPLDAWPDVPSSYVLCRLDRTLNPNWWRGACRERLGSDPIEIDSGHCPHVSRPAELAGLLSRIAKLP
ncbi:MAG: alpha/beta fold hydrolase [Terriglobales bacterium]